MQSVTTEESGGRTAAPEGNTPKECDLVMKGGITSGIVYPPLVIKLHEAGYSFRNMGGTSAGAIAAAAAAAAEYGKDERDKDGRGGFEKLKEDVQEWLGKDSNLRRLFQPSRETAPLMNTIFGYTDLKSLRWPPLRVVLALVLHDFLAFVAGAELGVLVSFLFSWLAGAGVKGVTHSSGLFVLALSALAGALAFCAWHLYHIVKNVLPDPRSGFGLCTGRGPNLEAVDETVLTDWLFARINDLAGKGVEGAGAAPLTFGELWGLGDPAHDRKKGRRIDLRMMTSDLSQNQPYVLPFEQDLFVFDEKEMRNYFPPSVVAHLVRYGRKHRGLELPGGYYFLPKAKDLPVIFATRLSLSFPVLISTVPLYTISPNAFGDGESIELVAEGGRALGPGMTAREVALAKDEAEEAVVLLRAPQPGAPAPDGSAAALKIEKVHLQRNWFSDGGICSNFPIHFFDAWLPSRPTFGVNLTSQLAKGVPQGGTLAGTIKENSSVAPTRAGQREKPAPAGAYRDDVYLPKPNEILPPEWIEIGELGKFLESIFRTAQNYRDNMQSLLPSYRERIVQIRLTDDEGGLNLDMGREVIRAVVKKGKKAGGLLAGFDLQSHQWVRFRVLMRQMEKSLYSLREAIAPDSFYADTLKTRPLNPAYPYRRDDPWLNNAQKRLNDIGQVIDAIRTMNPEVLFSEGSPRPEPVLRVTPEI
jgi:predicted acylesterase/phospholipase RssA